MTSSVTSDPVEHTRKVREMFDRLAELLRGDVERIDDPKAKALFETSAEVLTGLSKAFADHDARSEAAWRE
jgi:hypothetical protein